MHPLIGLRAKLCRIVHKFWFDCDLESALISGSEEALKGGSIDLDSCRVLNHLNIYLAEAKELP